MSKKVKAYTVADLEAMLAAAHKAQGGGGGKTSTDPTMDQPTGPIPKHLIVDRSTRPHSDQSTTSFATQAPARTYVNGDPRMLAGILAPASSPPSSNRVYNPFANPPPPPPPIQAK